MSGGLDIINHVLSIYI